MGPEQFDAEGEVSYSSDTNLMCEPAPLTRLIDLQNTLDTLLHRGETDRVGPDLCSGLEEGLDSFVEGGGLVVHDEVTGVVDAMDF